METEEGRKLSVAGAREDGGDHSSSVMSPGTWTATSPVLCCGAISAPGLMALPVPLCCSLNSLLCSAKCPELCHPWELHRGSCCPLRNCVKMLEQNYPQAGEAAPHGAAPTAPRERESKSNEERSSMHKGRGRVWGGFGPMESTGDFSD